MALRDLETGLARFPRTRFAHLPTPLERMPNLEARLREEGGPVPALYLKRDDCTGLGLGGNKTRKLEFLVADALAKGADTLVTTGALQSNHARQTAAAARKAGLACHLVLFDTVPFDGPDYRHSGNLLLDGLFGASVEVHETASDAVAVFEAALGGLKAKGRSPYFAPAGGSTPVGSLGYANAYAELIADCDRRGLAPRLVVHGSSSGGTQAGLAVGAAIVGTGPNILGINVYRGDGDAMLADIEALAGKTAELIGAPLARPPEIALEHGHLGPAYGVPTAGMREALTLVAETEGVLLDPVYSGKAMAGLLHLVRERRFSEDETVVFLHTGGAPGLFAYSDLFPPPSG